MEKLIPLPNKKYKIIYADPPWLYGFYGNKGRKVSDPKYKVAPYEGMNIEDIKQLPVKELAEKNSVLLMWITFPCLDWAKDVIEAWGFKYKTVAFTWVKRNKTGGGYFTGLGNYTRANAEICLLATRGKGCKVQNRTISQIVDTPVSAHSKKPDVIRKKIIKLFGDLSRIELFARTPIHGWDVWGNDPKLQNKPLENFIE
ncbi:MAG: MT-A70 family methyltransferase [Gammaproteobacteria bacterium]